MISRCVLRCALCVCLCASSTMASGQTANTSTTLKSEAIRLPSGRSATADVGHVEVPENRSTKASRAIEVAFIRVRNPETKSGAVNFVFAGGPGTSGVDLVRNLARQGGEVLFKLMPGDIVGIDERGVGKLALHSKSARRLCRHEGRRLYARRTVVSHVPQHSRRGIGDETPDGQ